MTATRRSGLWLGTTILLATCGAPWLSTGHVSVQHPDRPLAPPSLSQLELADRLTVTYRRLDAPVPTVWFDGTLVRGADPHQPLLPLGSDSLGRDQWTRLLYGGRLSLGLTALAVAGALLLGSLVGLTAGGLGGWFDAALMRLADLCIAWPALYVVLVLRAALPLSLAPTTLFVSMAAVLAFAGWPVVARAVRAVTVTERHRDYVVAAAAAGASPTWILTRHLWPAARPVLATQALLLIPAFILAEATLSFVGLGFSPATPSWGTMLIEISNPFVLQQAPWLSSPALAIALVTLAVHLAGDPSGPTPRQRL